MNKLIVAMVAASAMIVPLTPPATAQTDKTTAIGQLDMASTPDLDRKSVRSLQRALEAKGFDPGGIDGVVGPATRAAVSKFQDRYGMKATGEINNQTLFALGKAELALH
jgi:peptidoglycan hydrolase-like protein with peptidoglycan-binding domain